jgi:ABC-type lipoprotein export system ATPase subunit|tara:strand:- start:290 stop:814 length:525 start_codon:yes stop_codon:yes gene_type:complete
MISILDTPTSGSILFKGKNSKALNESQKNEIRKKNISMIFQDNNLLSDFSVIENVAMPLIIRNEQKKQSFKKAEKVLSLVNLSKRLNHFPEELSGGEQQRVAIARAINSETDLILADEPTGNLDYKTSMEIFNYFLKLKKLKKTIIFATHNRELAKKADYKLSILNGNIKRGNG